VEIGQLDRIKSLPPAGELYTSLRHRRPIIFEGVAADWPAYKKWSLDYFENIFGDTLVTAGVVKKAKVAADQTVGLHYERIPFREAAKSLREQASHEGNGLYLATLLRELPPSLVQDAPAPGFCQNGLWHRSKVWLGSAGMMSPLHYDIPDNLHVQISGRKRFTLLAPDQGRYLYPWPLLSKLPTICKASLEEPDFEKYPRLREASAFTGVLEPGDALFVPSFWWHQAKALSQSLSVNYWWASGLRAVLAWGSDTAKRLLGVTR